MNRIQLIQNGSGESFALQQGTNVVGRDPDCEIQLNADGVSRQHCRIDCMGSSIIVRDLGSTNGTFVNEEATTRVVCDLGDQLRIGPFEFQLAVGEPEFEKEANLLDSLLNAEEVPAAEESSGDLLNGLNLESLESVAPTDTAPSPGAVARRPAPPKNLIEGLDLDSLESATPTTSNASQEPSKQKRRKQRPRKVAVAPDPADLLADATPPIPAQPLAAPSTEAREPATPEPVKPRPTSPAPSISRPKPKPKVKRERTPRDWSSIRNFFEEKTGLAITLLLCLVLAAVFVVPWSNLMRTSDVTILEFYEKAVQDIQSGAPSPEVGEQLKEQNAAYVAELSGASDLSMAARQLLRAGRDHLLPALAETKSPESGEQALLEQSEGRSSIPGRQRY